MPQVRVADADTQVNEEKDQHDQLNSKDGLAHAAQVAEDLLTLQEYKQSAQQNQADQHTGDGHAAESAPQ